MITFKLEFITIISPMKHIYNHKLYKLKPGVFLQTCLLLISLSLTLPNQSYAQTSHTVCTSGCDFTSIQAAINAASAGDFILLGAGDIAEASQIQLNKAVTIVGPNSGIAGDAINRSAEARIVNTRLLVTAAATLDGLEIYQTNNTDDAILIQAGATIVNSIIRREGINAGTIARGITTAVATTGYTIEDNLFTGDPSGGFFSGHTSWNSGIFSNGGSGSISNNRFENLRTAINLDNFNANITLQGNTFHSSGTYISFGGTTPTDGQYSVNDNEFFIDFNDPNSLPSAIFNNSNVATTFRIDATYNTFGGLETSALTNEQKGAVENRLFHRGRSGRNGVINFVAGEQVVAPTTTIQSAIDAAAPGEIVLVSAGTYNESVIVNKSITLLGPNAGISPNTGTRAAEAVLENNANGRTFSIYTGNTDVIISGFTFDGGSPIHDGNDTSNPQTSDVTFSNNIVVNANAIYAGTNTSWKNLEIDDNKFEDINATNTASAMQILNTLSSTITNNTIVNANYAALVMDGIDGTSTVYISNNTINGTGVQAIQLAGAMGNTTVINNSITDANGFAGADRGAIRLYGSSFTGSILISNNEITGGNNGITVRDGEDISGKDITVTGNSITNLAGGKAIYHGGTGELNAVGNWFGSQDFSSISSLISGDVTYFPFLIPDPNGTSFNWSGTDTYSSSGLGPVVNQNTGVSYASIEEAAADSSPGDVITVANGEYTGDVEISASNITISPLQGQSPDFEGTLTITGANVEISGFNFIGVGPHVVVDPSLFGGDVNLINAYMEQLLSNNTFTTAVVIRNNPIAVPTIFGTIQAAIDVAVAGQIIQVLSGTYSGTITVNKPLTLRGANHGVAANDPSDRQNFNPARGAESIIEGTFILQSNDITIDGFSITGNSFAIQAPGTEQSNISILNNYMYSNTGGRTIEYWGASQPTTDWVINGNRITDLQASNATAITVFNISNLEITNNTIFHNNASFTGRRGINVDGGQDVTIANNIIDLGLMSPASDNSDNAFTNARYPIQLSSSSRESSQIVIEDNILGGAYDGIITLGNGDFKGIGITNNSIENVVIGIRFQAGTNDPAGIHEDINISGNSITSSNRSVFLQDGIAGLGSGDPYTNIGISLNRLIRTTEGAIIQLAENAQVNDGPIDATKNWFGSPTPDFATIISGDMLYIPFASNEELTVFSTPDIFNQTQAIYYFDLAGVVNQMNDGDEIYITSDQNNFLGWNFTVTNPLVPGGVGTKFYVETLAKAQEVALFLKTLQGSENEGSAIFNVTEQEFVATDETSLLATVLSAGSGSNILWPTGGLEEEFISLPVSAFTIEIINGQQVITGIRLPASAIAGNFPSFLQEILSLKTLDLSGNIFVGAIPRNILNLTNLTNLDISYNGLYTDDPEVKAFLDALQPVWDQTQTVSPLGSSAELLNPSAIISWTPITYQGGTGRYFIKYRAEDEGGFTTITVEGKGSSEGLIPNLAYGKKYLVYVQSQTDANPPFNPSAVTSDLGEVIELFFATPIAATERAALIALYEAMGGDDWKSNDNWKDPVNFSASGTEFLWKGVTLSKVNNVWSVTGIDLSTNNLNGTLPDLFAAFPNLTSLNLSGNCLAGAVPASLSSLQNLQSLNLSDNRFNSFTLTSLSATDVNLSYNALGGTGDNTALLAQLQADYLATQTLTPSGISATTVGDASATVSWQAIAFSAGEGHYELRLRKVGTTNWSTRATENKGQTTLQYTGLEANTSYEVQIRSVRIQRAESCFTFSAWSESTTFMTLPAMPARAALSSPTDYALNTATSLNLVVKETAFAANYEIQLSTSQDFSAATTVSFTSASGEQAVDGLLNNTRYYWRARGVNGRGAGEWSAMSQFRTGLNQAAVVATGADFCATEGAQVFAWNAIAGASHYRVEIATDANFSNVVRRARALQSTQLTITTLAPNQTYYWRVQGFNDVSAYVGNWSATGQVNVQPRVQVAGELELCANANSTLSLQTAESSTIQWYANGAAIAGATGNSYSATAAGVYYAILTTEAGGACNNYQTESITITAAEVSIPAIMASTTTLCEGESTTLSTSASGNSYQWFRNGTAIAGATAQSYRTSEAGTYSVQVSANQTCSATSNGLAINVTAIPAQQAITVAGSLALCGEADATNLSLTVAQGQTIQWYRNGTMIANATAPTLVATQAGTYHAIISNGNCSMETAAVAISGTILAKPVISMSQFGQTQINLGRPVAIQSTYAPTGVGYQWLYNGVPVEGANTAILLASRNGRYQMQLTSQDGCTSISEEFEIAFPAGKEPQGIAMISLNPRDLMEIAKEISDGWLQAFPNPTQGMLTISVSADRLAGQESVDVRVVDFLGRVVYNGKLMLTGDRYEVNFNMANLSKGIYYIYVEDGNISHRKVVKKE